MCIAPLTTKNGTHSCGQCRECLVKKSYEWSQRCTWESKKAASGVYITLTYDDENVPWIENKEDEIVQSLNKRDFQLFIKRLRKKQSKYTDLKIRYFSCGEYGGQTLRPHYHALIWNIHPKVINEIYDLWDKGFIKVGSIQEKSIKYVTNYMQKKDVMPPRGAQKYFTLMSRAPGIGAHYIDLTRDNHIFHEDFKLQTPMNLEKRPYLPRYYSDRIFDNNTRAKIISEKVQAMDKDIEDQFKQALKKGIKDPFGYILKNKKAKQEHKKRKQEFYKQKNKKHEPI